MGVLLASQPEDLAGEVEGLRIDERRVGGGMVGVAKEDLAEVDPVAQHGEHGHVVPRLACLGAMAVFVEPGGDGLGAVSLAAVAVEDDGHERRLVGVDDEVSGGRVDEVAVGARPAAPLAAGGFAFHAGDDPVDDGRPFELGEHAEHLDHHPSGWGGGVERLGGRTERHTGGVERFEQAGQTAHRPGEAVDPVDEKEVEAVRSGLGERSFEVGAFGGRPRRLVAEGADQLPVFLAVDIGAQSGGLGFEGVRLMGLVGRDSGVGGDLHGWTSLCGLVLGPRRRPRSPPTVKAMRRAHRTSSRRPSAPRPVTRAFAVARRQRLGGEERRQEVGEGDEGSLLVFGVEGHLDGWQHHELVLSVGAPPWSDAAPSGCH
nr:hypothetical protein [Acidiferrimicrobium sp. IK]